MSLALSCACGARFEVEETFAGQEISCPDCHQPMAVPSRRRQPVRTSGLAVASVVLSLVGAFTLVLTLLAALLGGVALLSIRRNRDRITGAGYAVFGMVAGLVFSGLFLVAIFLPELFGEGVLQDGLMGMQTDRSGSLEIVRPSDGFAITRPSARWGVARPQLHKKVSPDCKLLLVKSSQDTYLEVEIDPLFGRTMEDYRNATAGTYRDPPVFGRGVSEQRFRHYSQRSSKQLDSRQGKEVHELFFDVQLNSLPLTFLIRFIGPTAENDVYVLRSWAPRRQFAHTEAEIRQAFDSFRLLDD